MIVHEMPAKAADIEVLIPTNGTINGLVIVVLADPVLKAKKENQSINAPKTP